ncbi:MAG: hypothetical protein HYR76_08340 [Ignavibacteria bacterium]|nr:hypothetical protein [Ignavibacteria bacterium]
MKNIVITLLFALLLMIHAIGCGPVDGPMDSQVPISRDPVHPSPLTIPLLQSINLVTLPDGNGKGNIITTTQLATVVGGGKLSLTYSYTSKVGTTVYRTATLTVPARALSKDTYITMTFDTSYVAIKFKPEGLIFNHQSSLDFTAKGLDPATLVTGLAFYYSNDNGSFELIPNLNLSVDLLKGNVYMTGGVISHFSRYGFGR